MALTQKSRASKLLISIPILVLGGLLLLLWQRQYVYDEIKLYNYTPPTEIAQLASDSTMTSTARRYYYVNHPQLESRDAFSSYCPVGTEQSVVLGCYKSQQRGIYLLQVNNSELQGIEQVTAAHEMLHSAYDRLSAGERQRVDGLLQDYYNNRLTDPTIKATIADYRTTEPNDVVNEMHSVFGTEVPNLPPALEDYYSRYFTRRSQVTGLYATYQQAFTGRQQQIKQYDSQLNASKKVIDDLQASVKQQQTDLQSQRATLDAERSSDVTAYNAGVDSYNAAVNRYNANLRQLQSLITTYNALVAKRNSIAFEERQLVESLSAPAATQ